jgi:hypothetical protein
MLCHDYYHLHDVQYANRSKIGNILEMIRKYYQKDWFMNQTASWNTRFQPVFTDLLTRRGFGSTFNMLVGSKLFTNE